MSSVGFSEKSIVLKGIPKNKGYYEGVNPTVTATDSTSKKFYLFAESIELALDSIKFAANFDSTDFSDSDIENQRFSSRNGFSKGVLNYIDNISLDQTITGQAKIIIDKLQKIVFKINHLELPNLTASIPEQDELLINLEYNNMRLGFSFEIDTDESSWYIVNDDSEKSTTAWGYIKNHDKDMLTEFLMNSLINE